MAKPAKNKSLRIEKSPRRITAKNIQPNTGPCGNPPDSEQSFFVLQHVEIPFEQEMVDREFQEGVLHALKNEYQTLVKEFSKALSGGRDSCLWFVSEGKDCLYDLQEETFVPDPKQWDSLKGQLRQWTSGVRWELVSGPWLKTFMSTFNDLVKGFCRKYPGDYLRMIGGKVFTVKKPSESGQWKFNSSFSLIAKKENSPEDFYIPVHRHASKTLVSFLKEGFVPNTATLTGDYRKFANLYRKHPSWFNDDDAMNDDAVLADFRKGVAVEGVSREAVITEVLAGKRRLKSVTSEKFLNDLLGVDERRFGGDKYAENWLTDIKRGHWDLWPAEQQPAKDVVTISVSLKQPIYARNPLQDVRKNAVVAIDFGTKSTAVAFMDGGVGITPFPVGQTKELANESGLGTGSLERYENPTVIHFINLDTFLSAYRAKKGRPDTHWADLVVSHVARNAMLEGTDAENMSSFAPELKQWAISGRKMFARNQHPVGGKRGPLITFDAYEDKPEDAVDPIELYAYYVGCSLNNMYNRIFLNYVLSYPVTFDGATKGRILKSFEKGLRQSLPSTVLNDAESMKLFSVRYGNSEPGAYAVCALDRYKLLPTPKNKEVFYGVFDFGGGTTDFDFGLCTMPSDEDADYDYVIDRFPAIGYGDRYLGGENILRDMAYTVFVENRERMFSQKVSFAAPYEKTEKPLANEGKYVSETVEAETNIRQLMEVLRPLWEHPGDQETKDKFGSGKVKLNVFNDDGDQLSVELLLDADKLGEWIEKRIQKGVNNFFVALKGIYKSKSLAKKLESVKSVNVLLAGNSCRSRYVHDAFEKAISAFEKEMRKENVITTKGPMIIEGSCDANADAVPTCKTGVVWGLLLGREGGGFKFIGEKPQIDDVGSGEFNFYVGRNRRDEFHPVLTPQSDGSWRRFRGADVPSLEFWYSTDARVMTKVAPAERYVSARLEQDYGGGIVVIRPKSSHSFEFAVVASEADAKEGKFLRNPQEVELPR